MTKRLAQWLAIGVFLLATSVSAQEAPSTAPSSAPSSAPAASMPVATAPVVAEVLTEEQQKERLAQKAGMPFAQITPQQANALLATGTFNDDDLALFATLWKPSNNDSWKRIRNRGLLFGIPLHLGAITIAGGASLFASSEWIECRSGIIPFRQTVPHNNASTGELTPVIAFPPCAFQLSPSVFMATYLPFSLFVDNLGEKLLVDSPSKAKRVKKYRWLQVGIPVALESIYVAIVIDNLRKPASDRYYDDLTGAWFCIAALVAAPTLNILHYRAIKKSLQEEPTKPSASTSSLPSARLQLDLSPIAMPDMNGKLSTGIGILGSW